MGDRDATQEPHVGSIPTRPPWRVERFDEIDSTNRLVMERVAGGEPDRLVVVADFQTRGRGRLGREWVAPPGSSLLVSVLLRPDPRSGLGVDRLHLVTMAASLALAEAVEAVSGVHAELKWPNDLVVADRKLAGVLSEVVWSADGQVDAVVVGVGCNVVWSEVPAALAGRATACNLESDAVVDRDVLLDAFLSRLEVRRSRLASASESIVADYRSRLATLGRTVRIEMSGEVVEGRATDLDHQGRLVVTRPDGSPVTIVAGDVFHVRS